MNYYEALIDVAEELDRQRLKFGEQNHPDGTGGSAFKAAADTFRQLCDWDTKTGAVTWRIILQEEVYEALAESDPAKLRAELVQVAAVAVQWILALGRRGNQ